MSALDIARSSRPRRDKGKARALDPCQDAVHSAHSVGPSRCTSALQASEPGVTSSAKGKARQKPSHAQDALPDLPDPPSQKRSLRELGSSPSSSPKHLAAPLELLPAPSGSNPQQTHTPTAHAEPPASSSATSSSRLRTRSQLANKKRRSEHPDHDETTSLALSLTPTTSAEPPRSGPTSRSRRASLLVNSGTTTTRSSDLAPAWCESPEPIEPLSHPNQTPPQSAPLADPRSHRPLSSLRRRRGFYSRESTSARTDAAPRDVVDSLDHQQDSASSSSRHHQSSSHVLIRPEHSGQSDRLVLQQVSEQHASVAPDDPVQIATRTAPQLPHLRATSPLDMPFAFDSDHERSSEHPAYTSVLRNRRTEFARRSSRRQDEEHYTLDTQASSGILRRAEYRATAHADASTGPTALSRSAHPYHPQSHTLRQEASAARTLGRGRSGAAPWSERRAPLPASDQPPRAQPASSTDRSLAPSRETLAAQSYPEDDRSAWLHRRREQDALDRQARREAASSAHREPELRREHRDAPEPLDRLREAAPWLREPLPWRSLHFGLRTPSQPPERAAGTAPWPWHRTPSSADGGSSEVRAASASGAASRATSWAWMRQERNADESALEYLGRLMSQDSMLDEWMAGEVSLPSVRTATASGAAGMYAARAHAQAPGGSASSSVQHGGGGAVLLDARNFVADDEWAELNSYEALVQLGERLGAAEVGVPASVVATLPTCEYAQWDGGSCAPRAVSAAPRTGKGKAKEEVAAEARDVMCPICRDDYADADVLMSINTCHHAFHADCIKTWFRTAKTCPLCRADAFDALRLPALRFPPAASIEPGALYPPWSFQF